MNSVKAIPKTSFATAAVAILGSWLMIGWGGASSIACAQTAIEPPARVVATLQKDSATTTRKETYKTLLVDGVSVFYREAGDPRTPTLLLLHGFPTSSHMFRDLIPELAAQYHVIAPDLPGFGFTTVPADGSFHYTFDSLAHVIDDFTVAAGLSRYALYVFDYGAPVGWRLAMAHPEKITAIVSQNGNAYVEGLSDGWKPIQAYWSQPTAGNRAALRAFLTPQTTRWQYIQGVPDPTDVSPDGPAFDQTLLERKGEDDIQLNLFLDYASNVALYPKLHEYFRKYQPPLIAVWGKNDPFFLPAGAEAFRRDLPQAEVSLFDTGHFALETHHAEIAAKMLDFLHRELK